MGPGKNDDPGCNPAVGGECLGLTRSSHDTALFKVHEGVIVRVERSEDGSSLVRLPDEKRGWLRYDAIESIMRKAI